MPAAYCGPAPQPSTLWTSWNFDPVAIALALTLVVLWARQGRRPAEFGLATLIGLVLFITPFCALTVSLFSARVAHHVVLIAVLAPLLARAFPSSGRSHLSLPILVALHTTIVWFWHAPPVYAFAIHSAPAYWAMQLSLAGSAVAVWRRALDPETGPGPSLLALLAVLVQMGMLGALLTFARDALYVPHFHTTAPFGLTPIQDQQLGGLIMWVPASLPYLLAAALILARHLDRTGAQAGSS